MSTAYASTFGSTFKTDLPDVAASYADRDSDWVALARTGDADAFATLVVRHTAMVSNVIRRMVQNREDAEDAVQETFVRAFLGLNSFRGEAKFTTWLTRIAVNQAFMCLRKRKHAMLSIDQMQANEEGFAVFEVSEEKPGPEQIVSAFEMEQKLQKAIAMLPPNIRAAFQLKVLGEGSTIEVATQLGISVPAVKSRVLRARRKVSDRLNRELPIGTVSRERA
jgi:RNA polymerase sigma-70 factor, ECF subfamily